MAGLWGGRLVLMRVLVLGLCHGWKSPSTMSRNGTLGKIAQVAQDGRASEHGRNRSQ